MKTEMFERNYTPALHKGTVGDWEVVIGMEVHAQVISNSKLFSGASAVFGAEPNTHVSFIDAAFPGMLPVINSYCVDQTIKTGLGLNAKINLESQFDRKSYFYPDSPLGYQISQFYKPIIGPGWINVMLDENRGFCLRINHIHLEHDAGKSFHDQHPHKSYIDLNRAGVALMEIVTEPDVRSADEAAAFLRTLRILLRYLETCDGNMEEGSMRADVNVSVMPSGCREFGTRVEIKNINSARFIEQAIAFEVSRQVELLENGKKVDQETRLFDSSNCETRSMRSKENAQDYRYMPDPDLPPLILTKERIESIRGSIPELPEAKQARLRKEYGLPYYDVSLITSEPETADYYEKCLDIESKNKGSVSNERAKMLANWFIGDLFSYINKTGIELKEAAVTPEYLVELVDIICNGTISGKIAKEVFDKVWSGEGSPSDIVKKSGMQQLTDSSVIGAIIDEVISNNQIKVKEYLEGKDKLFGFFVGQVMKKTDGKANPQAVNEILKSKLAKL